MIFCKAESNIIWALCFMAAIFLYPFFTRSREFDIICIALLLAAVLKDCFGHTNSISGSANENKVLSPLLSIYVTEVCTLCCFFTAFLSLFFYSQLIMHLHTQVTIDFILRISISIVTASFCAICIALPATNTVLNEPLHHWVVNMLFLDVEYSFISGIWCVILVVTVNLAAWIAPHTSRTRSRKVFHLAIVLMLSPVLSESRVRSFASLSLGGVCCIFIILEHFRSFVFANLQSVPARTGSLLDQLKVVDRKLNDYFQVFEGSDNGSSSKKVNDGKVFCRPVIYSHLSLLVGVASTIWIDCRFINPSSITSRGKDRTSDHSPRGALNEPLYSSSPQEAPRQSRVSRSRDGGSRRRRSVSRRLALWKGSVVAI